MGVDNFLLSFSHWNNEPKYMIVDYNRVKTGVNKA
jgi:hypothetical protein